MPESGKELTYKAFMNREYAFKHSPFEKEFAFYVDFVIMYYEYECLLWARRSTNVYTSKYLVHKFN